MGDLVRMVDIHKSYAGGVKALDGVNLNIGYNEIVGLVGDNGAGKSTLIKILSGVVQPDRGELYFKDQRIDRHSVVKARELGIETVHQERALCEQHSLWKNIFMGRELTNRLGFLRIAKEKEETQKLMRESMGFTASGLTPDSIVKGLSGGEKQGVTISRALYFEAELLILDEPTNALSLSETKKVFSFVEDIKRKGKSCIFITHNIYSVFPVVDRLVILDRGKNAGEFLRKDISLEELVERLNLVARTGKVS